MTEALFISVVIPSYEAAGTLPETLRSLEGQAYDRARFEVILVDDGSTDDTETLVREFVSKSGCETRYLRRDRSAGYGAAVARNDGQALARGRIIAFIDADAAADPDWLSVIERAVIMDGHALVGGETRCDETVIFPWKMSPAGRRGITVNLAYDRARCGLMPFDALFQGLYGEDADFILQAEARGFALAYVPEMRVAHPVRRMRLGAVLKRALWRKNEVLLYRRYGRKADPVFGAMFRPRVFGRISPVTLLNLAFLAAVAAVIVWPSLFPAFAALTACAIMFFFLHGYRRCVTYRPAGGGGISWQERAITLVQLAAYMPVFTLSHVIGSIEFRFLML